VEIVGPTPSEQLTLIPCRVCDVDCQRLVVIAQPTRDWSPIVGGPDSRTSIPQDGTSAPWAHHHRGGPGGRIVGDSLSGGPAPAGIPSSARRAVS